MTRLWFVLFAALLASAAAHPFKTSSGIRLKRQLVIGGETSQDANKAQYKTLAQESFAKFRATNPGGEINVKDIKVTKVTTQVVAGSKTKIDFTVYPSNGDEIKCHSEIFEQSWANKKEITVNCDINEQKSKTKRQASLPGGVVDKDPNGEEYKKLAQESLAKFSETNPGGPINAKAIKVTKVTYQVVAGSLTKLTFTVEPDNSEKFICRSEVWEQPWLKSDSKKITVNCDLPGQ